MTRVDSRAFTSRSRSEEHTSELQSHSDLVCRLLLEKKKQNLQLYHLSARALTGAEQYCSAFFLLPRHRHEPQYNGETQHHRLHGQVKQRRGITEPA